MMKIIVIVLSTLIWNSVHPDDKSHNEIYTATSARMQNTVSYNSMNRDFTSDGSDNENTSNLWRKFILYTFLVKGGEQSENSIMGNENLKRFHIDGVIEEIRNRKIYDKQHRKRQGVADIVSTWNDSDCIRREHHRPVWIRIQIIVS